MLLAISKSTMVNQKSQNPKEIIHEYCLDMPIKRATIVSNIYANEKSNLPRLLASTVSWELIA